MGFAERPGCFNCMGSGTQGSTALVRGGCWLSPPGTLSPCACVCICGVCACVHMRVCARVVCIWCVCMWCVCACIWCVYVLCVHSVCVCVHVWSVCGMCARLQPAQRSCANPPGCVGAEGPRGRLRERRMLLGPLAPEAGGGHGLEQNQLDWCVVKAGSLHARARDLEPPSPASGRGTGRGCNAGYGSRRAV